MKYANMKTVTNLLCALLVVSLTGLPEVSSAQIWKNLGKKLEKKVEDQASRRLERKIDEAIDKGMDKAEEAAEGAVKSEGKGGSVGSGNMSNSGNQTFTIGGDSKVSISDVYDFKLGVTYDIRNEENKKPMETTMWFGGSDSDYIGMSVPMQKEVFMVMQGANMVTFMLDQKKYMALGSGMADGILGAAVEEASDEIDEEESFSIRKIATERILSYECDVYEMISPEYTTKLWLTRDLDIEMGHFMSAFSTLVKSGGKFPTMQHDVGGLLLKMEGKSTADKGMMIMEATAVDLQGMQFDTSGYTNFGF